MVRELLLGDNPFIGVSHLAQEKAREGAKEASLENKVRVFEAAVESGATGFTFSTEESNLELLTYLSIHNSDPLNKMNFYILVPYAQSYIRRANVGGTQALIGSMLKDMLYSRAMTSSMLTALMSSNLERFVGPFIESELSPYLNMFCKERVVVLLHEVLTELIMAFNLIDLLNSLDSYMERKLEVGFGLETRNLGHLHRYLSLTGYNPKYLMTPFNPLGYQMAWNKEAVEEAVKELGGETRIIAINVLASGAASLDEAIEYISKFKNNIYAVATASMRPNRIRENFQKLYQAFLSDGK